MTVPLGIRNRNPGNLRPLPNTKWVGQQYVNAGFVVFDTAEHGIRALTINLKNQQDLHGLTTVTAIFTKYAPSSENDTAAYIAFVARRLGVDPNDPVEMHNALTLATMVKAVIAHENGVQPYQPEVIDNIVTALVGTKHEGATA